MENVTLICKNCNNSFVGKYCNHCGQSAHTGRINLHYLIHEIQHSILHVDKGIFYTIKELTLRPGETLRSYLAGKRVNYFKPFAFVIILGTIQGLVAHFLNVYPETEMMPFIIPESSRGFQQEMMKLIYGHYSMTMLIMVPFSALSLYFLFRKYHYNYWEFLIVCSYIVGMQILILFVFYLLYYCIKSLWIPLAGSAIAYGFYCIWVLIQFFNKDSKLKTGIKVILGYLLTSVLYTLFVFGLTIIAIIILESMGIHVHLQ